MILSGVFGYAATAAKSNVKYDKQACIEAVRQYAVDKQGDLFRGYDGFAASDFRVDEADRHFDYDPSNIGASRYYFEIQLKAQKRMDTRFVEVEIECRVDTRTGIPQVVDVDVDVD